MSFLCEFWDTTDLVGGFDNEDGDDDDKVVKFEIYEKFFYIIWKNQLDKIQRLFKISQPFFDIEKERAREEKRLNGEEFEQEFDSDESSLTERP